jgi:AcrR family transcriptional regulator
MGGFFDWSYALRRVPDATALADRPLRRDAERNRQRILVAASALFAERGLNVTLDDVAHRADVGVGTVYRRFPDKDHLIGALFDEQIAKVMQLASEALKTEDPWLGISQFLDRNLELQANDRGLRELMRGTTHAMALGRSARGQIGPVIAALVARAQASGQLRADVGAVDIALVQIMVGAIMDSTEAVNAQLWRRTLAIALDGLRATDSPADLPGTPPTLEQLEQIMSRGAASLP